MDMGSEVLIHRKKRRTIATPSNFFVYVYAYIYMYVYWCMCVYVYTLVPPSKKMNIPCLYPCSMTLRLCLNRHRIFQGLIKMTVIVVDIPVF